MGGEREPGNDYSDCAINSAITQYPELVRTLIKDKGRSYCVVLYPLNSLYCRILALVTVAKAFGELTEKCFQNLMYSSPAGWIAEHYLGLFFDTASENR